MFFLSAPPESPTQPKSRSGAVAGYLFLAFVFTIVLSVMMWHCVQHRSGYRKQIRRSVGIERFTPLPSGDGEVSRVVSMANLLVDSERNFHAFAGNNCMTDPHKGHNVRENNLT